VVTGPPAIPDAQSAVDAPLFVGQSTFPAPLSAQIDFTPRLATARADGGNSGAIDGPAPLGRAPVTGSAAVAIRAPLLWGRRGGLTAGCQIELAPGLTKSCLAAVDASTLTVQARWSPPGQDLNLATALVDDADRIIVTTQQRHLFVVSRPDSDGGQFRVLRDIDLNGHLADGQGLLASVVDGSGNLWFASGGAPPSGEAPLGEAPPLRGAATNTVVGYVTSDDQVVTTTLADQRAETTLAVDQRDVYLATSPAGSADKAGARGAVYDFTSATGQIETVWRESYDAGSAAKPGATTRGTGAPVVLLGGQYLAVTDNADGQSHLLIYLRGALAAEGAHGASGSTTSTALGAAAPGTNPASSTTGPAQSGPLPTGPTSTGASTTTPAAGTQSGTGTAGDPRLVCSVALFSPGASAITSAPIGYSSGDSPSDVNSVIVVNGYDAPPPLSSPSDGGPANNINQMAPGVARIDVLPDGSGCQTEWTVPLRIKAGPVLSTATGLVYGYTQDEARAAAGSYVWYFVAIDYRNGRVVWHQRTGAGSTKNDNRQPTVLGANGVLYQTLPLGLVWMRDVAQRP
jgi:hypothetical protein